MISHLPPRRRAKLLPLPSKASIFGRGSDKQTALQKDPWDKLDVFYTGFTLPETNIAPENWWLEDYFPFGKANFQGQC